MYMGREIIIDPDRSLWATVLLRAYKDTESEDIRIIRELHNWILSKKHEIGSFLWICEYLNLNSNRIKRKMLENLN